MNLVWGSAQQLLLCGLFLPDSNQYDDWFCGLVPQLGFVNLYEFSLRLGWTVPLVWFVSSRFKPIWWLVAQVLYLRKGGISTLLRNATNVWPPHRHTDSSYCGLAIPTAAAYVTVSLYILYTLRHSESETSFALGAKYASVSEAASLANKCYGMAKPTSGIWVRRHIYTRPAPNHVFHTYLAGAWHWSPRMLSFLGAGHCTPVL